MQRCDFPLMRADRRLSLSHDPLFAGPIYYDVSSWLSFQFPTLCARSLGLFFAAWLSFYRPFVPPRRNCLYLVHSICDITGGGGGAALDGRPAGMEAALAAL